MILVLVILCILVSVLPDRSDENTTADASQASTICEIIVENQLVAPSTAKFADYSQQQVWTLGKESGTYKNAFRVRSYVDAQNSFGAQIRTYYTCDISFNGGEWTNLGNWTIIDLDIQD